MYLSPLMEDSIKITAQTTFKDVGITRYKYVSLIESWLPRPEIIIVKGVRRSGKSTLLKQVASRLKKKAVYINFDDYRLLSHLNVELLEKILKLYPDINYFFF